MATRDLHARRDEGIEGSKKTMSDNPKRLDADQLLDGVRLLIIGGTGFLGKIFWAMMLDRYPQVGKIYLVVRSKKNETSEQRFWNSVAPNGSLTTLRERYGDQFEAFLREKIVPIDGDVGRAECGIDPTLISSLKGTIDAVVNVAGVVDFNPPLDEAIDANAFGAMNLISLARKLGDTPIFHTSTCYVAGSRVGPIYEVDPCDVPFPRAADLGAEAWSPEREVSECLELVAQARKRLNDAFRQSEFEEKARENLRRKGEPLHGKVFDEELANVRRKFINERLIEAGLDRANHWGWPNIYTYTKSIGEQLISKSGLPFTITRPACSESCSRFPSPVGTRASTPQRRSSSSRSWAPSSFREETFRSILSLPTWCARG
ncbi:MAG: SDR family oxidoreductase [Polyangiaceae bacterium]